MVKGGECNAVSSEISVASPVWRSSSIRSTPSRTAVENRIPDVKCEDPYVGKGRVLWPCGRCPSCRTNRRRIWTHRIMLEAMQHDGNSFVTLTYGDDNLPRDGSLRPEDLQGFFKRLRGRVHPRCIRHYSVGEYGDSTGRPHYHSAVFGIGCFCGPIQVGSLGERTCRCVTCCAVRDSWTCGHTMVGSLEERSAAYIAGYVLKKMNTTWDTTSNRRAPFARMSLKPGIGADAVPDVASVMMQYRLEEKGDVPGALRHGSSMMPLGRYLRNKLREQVGLPEGCPEHVIEALRQGLLPVWDYADSVCAHATVARYKKEVVKAAMAEINHPLNHSIKAKLKKGML